MRYILFALFILCSPASGEVIFEDNFDGHPDWELTQPTAPTALSAYSEESTIPDGYHSYYIAGSYYSDPGNNSLILSSFNARGGSGKCLTFWEESDTRGDGWASDNQLGFSLPSGQDEIYVRFYIRFQAGWQWGSGESYMKVFRMTHYHGGTPFQYFSGGNQHPIAGAHLAKYTASSNNALQTIYRYENTYYPDQASPSHSRSDVTYVNGGSYGGAGGDLVADSNWHCWEFYFKMNSAVGVADGMYRFWLDGDLVTDITDLAWSDFGSQESPRLNWNYLTIGGNTFNHFSDNSNEQEQYYQVDDFVVSTTPVGTAYTINSPSAATQFGPGSTQFGAGVTTISE